ncbi:MAG: malonyl-ACP O-methyltransferase BioC [Ectothiorhodospiraceae bacterium]|nr:malonyl-ACP O-methyltransferase BioC [Ectothiorhodospiraceae bacterium]
MNKQLQSLDKNRIRASFDAAAEHYDDVAILQREIGERMLDRLDLVKLQPNIVLDVGAGTGVCSHALSKRYKKSRVIAFDIAPNMLKHARQRGGIFDKLQDNFLSKRQFVCGDVESLPLADNSIDLIFSNATLQWCADLDQTFSELKRVLRPGGLLMFSTFGPDTLKELRQSWYAADITVQDQTSEPTVHVNDFIDMHDIGDAMLRTGFSDPVMDVENFTLTYPDAYQLMRELKMLGAHNVANHRRHSLTGKTRVKKMVEAYETLRVDGQLPATYEVVYGHAWAPELKNTSNRKDVSIPLQQLHPGARR